MSDLETNSFTFSNAVDIGADITTKKISFAKQKNGRYKCNECNINLPTQFLLNLHRVSRCPKLPYPCNLCELRFSNEYNYNSHQKIHSAPEIKQIAVAKLDATLSGTEMKAERSSVKKSPKKKTSDSSNARNRRTSARFLKEKALDFIERQKVQESKTSAKKNKKLDEDVSDTKQSKKMPLKNNAPSSSKASDDDGFSCEVCKIDFPDNIRLQRHMIVHGKKRSYQCTKCHMGFHWKSNFNRHIKTHDASLRKTYVCVTCGRVFSRRFCLFRHRQTSHPEEEAYLEDEQLTDILSLPVKEENPQKVEDTPQESDKEESDEDKLDNGNEESDEDRLEEAKEDSEEDMKENLKEKVEETEVDSVDGGNNDNEDDATYYVSEQEEPRIPWKRRRIEREPRRHHCDVCHIPFKWKCDLNRHRITHSEIKAYPCDMCELGFNWKSNLTRHKRTVHRIGVAKANHICNLCGQGFFRKFQLERHASKYCSKRVYVLDQTQTGGVAKTEEAEVVERPVGKTPEETERKKYDDAEKSEDEQMVEENKHGILSNINRESEEEQLAEETKEEILSDFTQEPDSVTIEKTPKDIVSDINQNVNIVYLHVCQNKGAIYDMESSCKNITSLPLNHDDNDNTLAFNAANDNENFSNSEDVEETYLSNETFTQNKTEDENGLYPFVCSRCNRRFARKTCYVQHERSHIIKPTKCGWCGKDFRRLSMLHKHERMHHKGEKPFPCDMCNSHFELKSQLMQHMKSHFKNKSQLVKHMKSQHPLLKAYECHACKCRFARQSLLDRHQLIHPNERPYKCGTCNLEFNQSCSLVLHQRMHVIEYKCSKCDLKFTQQVAYVRHLERVHFNDSAQNNVASRRVSSRRNRTSNKTYDPHAYNTRYKACKAEVIVEEIDSLEEKNPVDMGTGTAASGIKSELYNSTVNQEIFKSDEQETTTRNENSNNETFTQLQVRKDISVYESDSLNEFIKSYKRKHCDIGENSNSSDSMKVLVANEDPNLDVVQHKKIKNRNGKSRSRRSSEEIAISEGLANFHIGNYENVLGNNDVVKDSCENYSSIVDNKTLDENSSAHTSDTSYTNEGNFIMQHIITVESSLPTINLKCNEVNESSNENDYSYVGPNESANETTKYVKLNFEENGFKLAANNDTNEISEEKTDTTENVDIEQQCNMITESQRNDKAILNPDRSDCLDLSGSPKLNNSIDMSNGNDKFYQSVVHECNKDSFSKVCIHTIKGNQNVTLDAKCLVEAKISTENDTNCKETNLELVNDSVEQILPTQVKITENSNSTNKEEKIRFRPYIEIIKLPKDNMENEKDTELNEYQKDESNNIEKLQSLTDKLKENSNESYKSSCGGNIQFTQKHMKSFDEIARETRYLNDEIPIDKDNYICEMHSDKNDCIRGICTENDICFDDINVDNDCLNDSLKESMNDFSSVNNNSMGNISAYNSRNVFAAIRAETSHSSLKNNNENSLESNKRAHPEKQAFNKPFEEKISNNRDLNNTTQQYSSDRPTDSILTNKNITLDDALQRTEHNPTFNKTIDGNSKFNLSFMKQEKALNVSCYQQTFQPPVWKEVFQPPSNNNLPSCQYEHESHKLNSHGHNFYDGSRVDQYQGIKTLASSTDIHNKYFHNENHLQKQSDWTEPQIKEYPLHHSFVSPNENVPLYNAPVGEATYYPKNPWNQQEGIVIESNSHRPNEIPINYHQEPHYGNDFDEESIRYAVQTVQAIIQAEKPMHRESPCRQTPIQGLGRYGTPSFQETFQAPPHEVIHYQNFQVPSQYNYQVQEPSGRSSVLVQDMVRYHTPNYQAMVQNDEYVPQGLYKEGYPNSYQSLQSPFKNTIGSAQYGVNNADNSFRYGYVDENAGVQKIPFQVRPESVIDQDGRLVQLPVQYRSSPFVTYPARSNSVLYGEHYEEGPKQYLDLGSVQYSSHSGQYCNEIGNVNCFQPAPYERVEVTETVYTNLEMSSCKKPTAEGILVPKKEVFNDPGIMPKNQRSIVQYKNMYPYSATPNSFYTNPVRIQTIPSPSPTIFQYERPHTYTPGHGLPIHQVGQHRIQYISLLQDIPKNGQNSILVGRGRKRVRRGRVPSETAIKKPRRKKNECSTAAEQLKCTSQENRSILIDHSRQDPNKKVEKDKNEEIRIDLKDSTPETEIRISEKLFGCDECSRVFLLKGDLLHHRLTEHEKSQSGSH